MSVRNKIAIFLILFFSFNSIIFSQNNISIKISDINADKTGEVLIPIIVSDFYEVSAISWRIKFDESVLEFIDAVNVDQSLEAKYFSASDKGDFILVGWYSLTPTYIGENTIFELRFNYKGGNTFLDFIEPTKTAHSSGQLYETTLLNGSVTDAISDLDDDERKLGYKLSQNYLNPFNPNTTISFTVLKASEAKIIIYDLLGSEIMTVLDDSVSSGTHSLNFTAANLSSGVYLFKFSAKPLDGSKMFQEVKKMSLLK